MFIFIFNDDENSNKPDYYNDSGKFKFWNKKTVLTTNNILYGIIIINKLIKIEL